MSQHEIEVILTEHLASYLAMPTFLVDTQGNLLFYNEPAERILGQRFEETGEMPAEVWSTAFAPTREDGLPFPSERLPLVNALKNRVPDHAEFWIEALDGVRRRIHVMAFPLVGQGDRFLGAVAMFWEVEDR
jgi:PAS domain-containing protein